MYLKQIVTNGFKSFANKIDIKLGNNITCIVGPNGSGKSNIVDAVRWVLGEQSVKSLRGDNTMSDIIFSGSKNRKALNVASVELIFDNSDHFLNVPYTEISIKRRIYRSGENEYFLNNERCRLKDVTNLLLDSGIGRESFNIISQGEVESILSSSPTDRRVIFEETAGILKYKKRKIEALRKLDRTHNNLDRINDIIGEIELQVEPLREQSRKAKKYKEAKEQLEKYEIALLAHDIRESKIKLDETTSKKEKLNEEIIELSSENSVLDSKTLEDNSKIAKIESEIEEDNRKLLLITEEVEKINGEKELLKERKKQEKTNQEVIEEMRKLLEEKESINTSLTLAKNESENLIKRLNENKNFENSIKDDLEKEKLKKQNLINRQESLDRNITSLSYKINSTNLEIENNSFAPTAVKEVLAERSLKGIHDTLGNLLEVEDKYVKALETAIFSSKNFIITEDEISAKKAILFLKDNHLGRATFFPLSVIEPRYVDSKSLNDLKHSSDFIAVLSDLVSYEKQYENIIKNQLGTILVAEDMDSALRLSRLVNKRYKIITLDGEVLHVGGSMSGGSNYKSKSVITLKQQLSSYEKQKETITLELETVHEELSKLNKKVESLEDNYFKIMSEKVSLEENNTLQQQRIKTLEERLDKVSKDYENYQHVQNQSIDTKELELTTLYHSKVAEKETLLQNIKHLNKTLDELKVWVEEKNAQEKVRNARLRELEHQLSDYEVTINRLDVTLDNMLDTLNEEYSMTYEKASSDYELDMEVSETRVKVSSLKAEIRRIGMVNLDSIEEFERVNTRYEFLTKQKQDLLNAEETLLSIMNDMDEVMISEFEKTFEKVRVEFQKVFKELFKGGSADLVLTEPEDLLATGVEIVASPPGKKLTSISLLSGGEKTLTAISLMFAMLNVRKVPFCLFDEVEAALDEANVDEFGRYLDHYKEKTQFLIITHKKKTMEYADTLYGITMQESGVSKLVSVRLNDKEEVI